MWRHGFVWFIRRLGILAVKSVNLRYARLA
uniref:Uncharacterized protein n=1 Tax=Rhizophora mucronata TaxID=61149 RepID=A0A2P2NVF1_RHIMU